MGTYLLKRILAFIPMFFLMTGVYFGVQNYLPGGPVQEILAQIRGQDSKSATGKFLDVENIARLKQDLERQYGLDKPIWVRYGVWVRKIMTLDFGDSMTTRRSAFETLAERIPVSLSFGIPGFFLTYLVCIVLGVAKGVRDGSRFDVVSSLILFIAYSIPALVIAVVLLLVFCTDRVLPGGAIFPLGGAMSDSASSLGAWARFKDSAWHLFLPVCASLVGDFTILTLLMKNSLLDVLKSDYIRTARAKGLSETSVIFKHALRNAILPLLVGVGGILSAFVAGSIVIESVFNLPGMGLLLIESLQSRDYNVLMAVCVVQSMIILLGRLISDVAYVLVDPRIDFD